MTDKLANTYVRRADLDDCHRTMAYTVLRSYGCPHTDLSYNEQYDAYYCAPCNVWGETMCSDRRCLYCRRRPATPDLVDR